MDRSYIRVWSATDEGLSNEVKVPLAGTSPIASAASLTRLDKEKNIMYFMLVDRFVNGDTSIDEPVEDELLGMTIGSIALALLADITLLPALLAWPRWPSEAPASHTESGRRVAGPH